MYHEYMTSPVGLVEVEGSEHGITAIRFVAEKYRESSPSALTREASQQLGAYFTGRLTTFTVPLMPAGTDFQQRVWQALCRIPYGQTCSYRDIAEAIDNPKSVRAVGLANGKNPIAIMVPCHRVIGANGKLTGYAGGLERKAGLLSLEGAL